LGRRTGHPAQFTLLMRVHGGRRKLLPTWIRASRDPDHLKVFANADAAEKWFEENDPEGVAFESMRFWNEPDWPVFQN
jgi:hypothetical protein